MKLKDVLRKVRKFNFLNGIMETIQNFLTMQHEPLALAAHLHVVNENANNQFTECSSHTWKLLPGDEKWPNVVGFGSASIPSYENLARIMQTGRLTFKCLTWNINEGPAEMLKCVVEHLQAQELEDVISIAIQEISPRQRRFHEEALSVIGRPISDTHEIYFSFRAWSQMIMIFIRKSHFRYAIKCPSVKFVPSAHLAKPVRTKGSIGVCFRLYQRMIIIVASHLSHGSISERLADYHKMLRCLRFPTIKSFTGRDDVLFAADLVFWMGDLNFRIYSRSVPLPDDAASNALFEGPIAAKYLSYDELNFNKGRGVVFVGFKESQIRFPPTYKMMITKIEDAPQYNPKRKPSYTDRVLYWSKNENDIAVLQYNSINKMTASDHRPVHCSFEVYMINRPIPEEFLANAQPTSAT